MTMMMVAVAAVMMSCHLQLLCVFDVQIDCVDVGLVCIFLLITGSYTILRLFLCAAP